MFHDGHDAAYSGDQIHRSAHAFDHFTGNHPVGDVALVGYLQCSEDRQVDMSAANHGKGGCRVEIAAAGQFGNGLLARIDEIGIDFVRIGEWSHAKHAVFAVQGDIHA